MREWEVYMRGYNDAMAYYAPRRLFWIVIESVLLGLIYWRFW